MTEIGLSQILKYFCLLIHIRAFIPSRTNIEKDNSFIIKKQFTKRKRK